MSLDRITQWGLSEASAALMKNEVSSIELTKHLLGRIEQKDSELGAFLAVDEEGAIKAAGDSDARRKAGTALGPLDGIPVGLKDMILTKGLRTTAASRILENYVPSYEATVSLKLKDAGAVVLGKLNQDEFAMGSSNETSAFQIVSQSLGPLANSRRILRRVGCFSRSWPRFWNARYRYRWFHSPTSCLLWRYGA